MQGLNAGKQIGRREGLSRVRNAQQRDACENFEARENFMFFVDGLGFGAEGRAARALGGRGAEVRGGVGF